MKLQQQLKARTQEEEDEQDEGEWLSLLVGFLTLTGRG